jgi:methionyl-tRNA formyltransferase
VRRLSRRHGIPVHSTRNVNDAAGMAFVSAAQPDVLVCAFFNQRVDAALRALPRAAAVNIHPSLLPDFKGVDPVFFARLSRAPALGVTVHHLSEVFDAGHILIQQALSIPVTESLFRTTARLFARGGRLLAELLADGAYVPAGRPQTESGRYDSWPNASQVRQLRRQGVALLRMADLAWVRRADADGSHRIGQAAEFPAVRG